PSNPDSTTQQMKLSTVGPVLGATLLHGLTRSLGMQANLQIYHSTMGMKTPSGGPNKGELSYQAGLLGSLSLRPGLIGFMGYAYRVENGSYSSANAGDNKIQLSGHYVNFLLEYGF